MPNKKPTGAGGTSYGPNFLTATSVRTSNPAHYTNPIKPNVHIKFSSYLTKNTATQLQQQRNTTLILLRERISTDYEKLF
jgi:hypothetical protein